jgi:hypothetical protein
MFPPFRLQTAELRTVKAVNNGKDFLQALPQVDDFSVFHWVE